MDVEPTYESVSSRHFIGHGRELAELSEKGIQQAKDVSNNKKLKSAQLILSSPYTRALQTEAIISKNSKLDVRVETDLHEWFPDLTFQYDGPKNFVELRIFYLCTLCGEKLWRNLIREILKALY